MINQIAITLRHFNNLIFIQMKHLLLIISLLSALVLVSCKDSIADKLEKAQILVEDKDYESAEYICDGISEQTQTELSLEQKCGLTACYYKIFQGYMNDGNDGTISKELANSAGKILLKKVYKCYTASMKDDPIKAKELYDTKWEGVDDKGLKVWTNIYIIQE